MSPRSNSWSMMWLHVTESQWEGEGEERDMDQENNNDPNDTVQVPNR